MRYIKKYNTSAEVQSALNNDELGKPYVALIESEGELDWNSKEKGVEGSFLALYEDIRTGGTNEVGRYIYIPTDWTSYTSSTINTFICCGDNSLSEASPTKATQGPILKFQSSVIKFCEKRETTAITYTTITTDLSFCRTVEINGIEYYEIDMYGYEGAVPATTYLCGVNVNVTNSTRQKLLDYLNNGGNILYSSLPLVP